MIEKVNSPKMFCLAEKLPPKNELVMICNTYNNEHCYAKLCMINKKLVWEIWQIGGPVWYFPLEGPWQLGTHWVRIPKKHRIQFEIMLKTIREVLIEKG